MKNLLPILFIACVFNSCISDPFSEPAEKEGIYTAPPVASYTSYTSQNSVTLNGFIDQENIAFLEEDSYKVGFIFRGEDQTDVGNDQVIELEGDIPYFSGTYNFSHEIDFLEPNTTYYYTATTKNGSSEKDHWESFTTSAMPCEFEQDNFYSLDGEWKNASVVLTDPSCCNEGNVGFKFGSWPNTIRVNFNELENGYPQTGQYFGVDFEFDLTHNQRELVKSTNQVLFEYMRGVPETEMFVVNDGERISLIFCNTVFKDGSVLNGKVSVALPKN